MLEGFIDFSACVVVGNGRRPVPAQLKVDLLPWELFRSAYVSVQMNIQRDLRKSFNPCETLSFCRIHASSAFRKRLTAGCRTRGLGVVPVPVQGCPTALL